MKFGQRPQRISQNGAERIIIECFDFHSAQRTGIDRGLMPAATTQFNSGCRMATRLPPVHALTAFEAAARFGSFAVAAEELCITPSALSHRIRLLEDFVGERLFLRDGRTVTLSEFGRRYLDVVKAALRTL